MQFGNSHDVQSGSFYPAARTTFLRRRLIQARTPCLTCTPRERVFDALILHQWSVAKGLTSGNSAARRQLKCNLRVRSLGSGRRVPVCVSLTRSENRVAFFVPRRRAEGWRMRRYIVAGISSFSERKYRMTSRTGHSAVRCARERLEDAMIRGGYQRFVGGVVARLRRFFSFPSVLHSSR